MPNSISRGKLSTFCAHLSVMVRKYFVLEERFPRMIDGNLQILIDLQEPGLESLASVEPFCILFVPSFCSLV